jgi:hypothetical protein
MALIHASPGVPERARTARERRLDDTQNDTPFEPSSGKLNRAGAPSQALSRGLSNSANVVVRGTSHEFWRLPAVTHEHPTPGRPARTSLVVGRSLTPPTFQAGYALRPAAAANGSNRIALRCPRSSDINALTCLDDLH